MIKVKKLVWCDKIKTWGDIEVYRADSDMSNFCYRITVHPEVDGKKNIRITSPFNEEGLTDIISAKKACQTHYETLIRSGVENE